MSVALLKARLAEREKTAGAVDWLGGKVIQGITAIPRYLGRKSVAGASNVAGAGANRLRRGVAAAPLAAATTIGMAPMMLPDLRAASKGHRNEMEQIMAQNLRGPQKIGLASSLVSEEDRKEARSIRNQLEKQAGKVERVLGAGADVPAFARLMAAATILGAGSTLGAHALGKVYEGYRAGDRPKRYRAMLRAEPSLKREPMARVYFNVLDRASPYIAGEPFVAAATVRSMVETPSLIEGGVPAVGPRMMKEIMDAEESRQKSRFHPFKTVKPFKATLPKGFGEAEE